MISTEEGKRTMIALYDLEEIKNRVSSSGRALTHTEETILRTLLDNRGTVITWQELYHAIWDEEAYPHTFYKTLHVHLFNIRKKLKRAEVDLKINADRSVGYYID